MRASDRGWQHRRRCLATRLSLGGTDIIRRAGVNPPTAASDGIADLCWYRRQSARASRPIGVILSSVSSAKKRRTIIACCSLPLRTYAS